MVRLSVCIKVQLTYILYTVIGKYVCSLIVTHSEHLSMLFIFSFVSRLISSTLTLTMTLQHLLKNATHAIIRLIT